MRRAAFALAPLLALAAVAEGTGGGEAPALYRLVQTDGTVVVMTGPPAVKGSLLVGTLHPSGRLVSFPKASVDAKRTEEANRAVPPPVPAPSPGPKVLSDAQTSLGASHRLVTTPEEARLLLESARTASPDGPVPSSEKAARGDAEAGPDSGEEARDTSGRTEAWWRTHAQARRRELDQAVARRQRAETELEAAERDDLLPGEAQRRTFVIRVLEARDAAEKARADESLARARWEALREDARKSGTPPGWLR